MSYTLVYSKQAHKDAKKHKGSSLIPKIRRLLRLIAEDPFQSPPELEKLVGEYKGYFARRINVHHRIVYTVFQKEKIVKIVRLWTHYE
jgi:Txe/YoeB family toxin of toxin-antitoxin system